MENGDNLTPQEHRQGASGFSVDKQTMLSRVDGDMELLREVAATFERESVGMLSSIRTAIQEMDSELLQRAAHSIKGAVAIFDAKAAYDAAYELEVVGRNADWGRACCSLHKFEAELRQLESFFAELRQGNLL